LNTKQRKKDLETQSGFTIKKQYVTDGISNYHQIEKAAHEHFKHDRVLGEWFNAPFEEAAKTVEAMFTKMGRIDPVTIRADDTEEEVRERIKAIVDEHYNRFTYMEHLQHDDPELYELLVSHGFKLRLYNGADWIIGKNVDMALSSFVALSKAFRSRS
jgi:adenylate kinase family enzyme